MESTKRQGLRAGIERVVNEESNDPDRGIVNATDGEDLDIDSRGLALKKLRVTQKRNQLF